MNIFKCNTCDHNAEVAGFCPKDGNKLIEAKADDSSLAKFLDSVSSLAKAEAEKAIKEAGLDRGPHKKIFGDGKSMSTNEKYEHVKTLLNEKDSAHLEMLSGDEKAERGFLSKARIAYFFKNLVQFNLTKDPEYLANVKALAEGSDGVGGYLTPNEFRAELVRDIKDLPVMRNLVTVIPMASDYLELPTLLTDVITSWGSENTTISTTTATFGHLTFAPKRLNTFLYTSRELVADAALNVVQMMTNLFVLAIGREEDRVIINGSGSGQPKGILAETLKGIDNANVDANLATNLAALPYKLGQAYRKRGVWLINSRSLGVVRSLQSTTGAFIFTDSVNGDPGKLVGYPVYEQNDLPLDTIVFCDPTQYYLADREQLSVETTTDGAGTFEKHQVAIKVIERIDGKVANTEGFKLLTNAGID